MQINRRGASGLRKIFRSVGTCQKYHGGLFVKCIGGRRELPPACKFTDEARAAYEKYSAALARVKNITAVEQPAEYRYYDIDDVVKRAPELFDESESKS